MVQLTVRTTGATLVRQGLEDLTKEIPLIGRQRIYNKMMEVRRVMATPAPKPTYPIRWASMIQMIAYFRSGGFGHGIPYRRTGRHPRAWQLVKTDSGYRLENPINTAVHLYGNFEGARQSPIHEGRHPVMQKEVESAVQDLPSEIEQNITYYARGKGL